MQARRHAVSVRLCVVHSVKTNKRRPIFEVLSLSGTHTILVFLYQTAWQYSDRNTPNGASNAGAVVVVVLSRLLLLVGLFIC